MVAYIDRLLEPWQDDVWAIRVDMLATLFVFLLGLMIYLFNSDNPAVNVSAGFVTFIAFFRLILTIVEWRGSKNPFLVVVSFGDKHRAQMGALIGGALTIGAFMFGFVQPVSAAILTVAEFNPLATLLDGASVGILFTIVFAPIIEELVFRGLLFFTLTRLLKSALLAAVVVSLLFASYHYIADQGHSESAETLMMANFALSMIWIIANAYTKTIATSMASHAVLNYAVYFKVFG